MDENVSDKNNKIWSREYLDDWQCLGCKRSVGVDELYGAFGLCSQCLATEGLDEHNGG